MASEEVQRVADAITELGEIPDAMHRAKALSELLDGWPAEHARARQLRQQAFLDLKAQGWSYRKLAAEFGITAARVGQIMTGDSLSGTKKAAKKAAEAPSAE